MAILLDFQCKDCGITFEEFYTKEVNRILHCPSCGTTSIVKLLSAPAQLNTNGADKNSHRTSNNRHKK